MKCVANQQTGLDIPPPEGYWIDKYGLPDFFKLLLSYDCIRNRFQELLMKSDLKIRKPSLKASVQDVIILKKVIKDFVGDVQRLDAVQIDVFLGFLGDYGYLNVIEKLGQEVVVCIPDREIFSDIFVKVQTATLAKSRQLISGSKIKEFIESVRLLQGKSLESLQRFADAVANLYSEKRVPEPTSQVELQGLLFTFLFQLGEGETHAEMYIQMYRRFRLDNIIVRNDGSGIIGMKVNYSNSYNALRQIFSSKYHRSFERYNITKEKIYIGLYYEERQITVSSVSTAKVVVVNSLDDFSEDEVIRCSAYRVE